MVLFWLCFLRSLYGCWCVDGWREPVHFSSRPENMFEYDDVEEIGSIIEPGPAGCNKLAEKIVGNRRTWLRQVKWIGCLCWNIWKQKLRTIEWVDILALDTATTKSGMKDPNHGMYLVLHSPLLYCLLPFFVVFTRTVWPRTPKWSRAILRLLLPAEK
jgi:hypothetical protein